MSAALRRVRLPDFVQELDPFPPRFFRLGARATYVPRRGFASRAYDSRAETEQRIREAQLGEPE